MAKNTSKNEVVTDKKNGETLLRTQKMEQTSFLPPTRE